MLRKLRKIRIDVKCWLHFHNPRILFCSHKFSLCGESDEKYGHYKSYRCSKCGKCVSIQVGSFMNTCD